MGDLLTELKKHIPVTWDKRYLPKGTIRIMSNHGEFLEIANELKEIQVTYKYDLISLKRVQNIYTYGRYLFREQQKQLLSTESLFRVRRYIVIKKCDESAALEYNLDPRRYRNPHKGPVQFSIDISNVQSDEIVIIVSVISSDLHATTIAPERDNDYYIEYVAEVQRI